MDVRAIVNEIQERVDRITPEGLWDVSLLDATQLQLSKTRAKSAREATDKEFASWLEKQMGGLGPTNRLRWRMFCLYSLAWLKALHVSHFRVKKE